MKHLFPLCVLLLVGISTIAQIIDKKALPDPKFSNDPFHYRYIPETNSLVIATNDFRNDLSGLKFCADSFHYRFSNEIYAVDIWTNDFKSYHGEVFYYTHSYEKFRNDGKNKPSVFYYERVPTSDSLANALAAFINKWNILAIPTRDSIVGWNIGFDGDVFRSEECNRGSYLAKSYWTPSAFKNIPQAVVIDTFQRYTKSLFDLDKNWYSFISVLPTGSYAAQSYFAVLHRASKKRAKSKKN